MKAITVALLLGYISAAQVRGIFELSANRIMADEVQKNEALELVKMEAAKELEDMERDKIHKQNLIEAEI